VSTRLRVLAAAVLVIVLGGGAWVVHARTHQPLSVEHRAALKAAHQVQSTIHGAFLVATYRPDAGRRGPSNTGHPCKSGPTVQVRLLWDAGASFTHGGVPGEPPDGPRQALIVTADGVTGVPCLIGASYADDDPRPGEIYLYGPRKDLVPPP
jgi:hypothetical protein